MYEAPLSSLLACSFWQAACSHPPLFASVPALSMLWMLLQNWRATRAEQPAVQRAPGLMSLAAAALLPIWWLRPALVPRPDLRTADQRAPGGFVHSCAPTQAALVADRAKKMAATAREAAELQAAAEQLEKDLSVLRRRIERRPSSGLLNTVRPTPSWGGGGSSSQPSAMWATGQGGVNRRTFPAHRIVVAGAFCEGGREGR